MGDFADRLERCPAQIRPNSYAFRQFLNENGENDLSIDGSVTPIKFISLHGGPIDSAWILTALVIVIETESSISCDKFGDLDELENGLRIFWKDSKGYEGKATAGFTIKRNTDFALLTGESPVGSDWPVVGPPTDYYRVCLGFSQMGAEIILYPGEGMVIEVRDDLTGLTRMRAACHGFIRRS